jgi:N-methylhydantoinase A
MLVSPVRKDVARTVLRSARVEAELDLADLFLDLEAQALAAMREEGLGADQVSLTRRIDARYEGQSYELTVPADGWLTAFHALHQRQFGFATPGAVVQAVSLRVEALAPAAAPHARWAAPPAAAGGPVGHCAVHHQGQALEATRWDRDALCAGHVLTGPALVTEYSATLWIPPGFGGTVLEDSSIVLERWE